MWCDNASVAPDVPPLPDVEQSESEATTDDDVEAWTLSILIGVFFPLYLIDFP